MYAVIKSGGKQARVTEGEILKVERLHAEVGDEIEFDPILVVDGDTVMAKPADLEKAKVTAKIVGETKGPKIEGFTYKNKSNNHRRWGHRQIATTIEITQIAKG